MRHLDLFSGIGGFALAARNVGWDTVGFCEIDPWCQKVLAKNFPGVPIHDDIKTYRPDGPVDIVTGGYPCQPFSVAGQRGGEDDDRHLWPEMLRTIKATEPRYVVGENVAGHITMGLDQVLFDLEAIGYTVRTFVIPACAVDARHRRDRVWIIADSNSERVRQKQELGSECEDKTKSGDDGETRNVAYTNITLGKGNECAERGKEKRANHIEHRRWPAEPSICRVAHGIPNRSHRLRGLGNAIVPQVAEVIFGAINAL